MQAAVRAVKGSDPGSLPASEVWVHLEGRRGAANEDSDCCDHFAEPVLGYQAPNSLACRDETWTQHHL